MKKENEASMKSKPVDEAPEANTSVAEKPVAEMSRWEKDILVARRQQEERIKAPACLGSKGESVHKTHQRLYAKDTIQKVEGGRIVPPEYKNGYFDLHNGDYEKKRDLGWEPVLKDDGSPDILPGGRTMQMKIPYKIWKAEQDAKSKRSMERLMDLEHVQEEMKDVPKEMKDTAFTSEMEIGGLS